MAKRILLVDTRAYPILTTYQIATLVNKIEGLEDNIVVYGQGSKLSFEVESQVGTTLLAVIPTVGFEVIFYESDFYGANLHKYYWGGVVNIVREKVTANATTYILECTDFSEQLITHVPDIQWDATLAPDDSFRISELFATATSSWGLQGSWDASTRVTFGGFVTYDSDSVTNKFHRKTMLEIIQALAADSGLESDPNYPVAPRRWGIDPELLDPANPTLGIKKYFRYYSGTASTREPVPFTDRTDGRAYWFYDDFNRTSNLSMSPGTTGQTYVEYSGNWQINLGRAYMYTNGALNPDLLYADSFRADGEFGVTMPIIDTGTAAKAGLMVRGKIVSGNWTGILFGIKDGTHYAWWTRSGGVDTEQNSWLISPLSADRLTVVTSGTSITFYINSTPLSTITSSFNQTETLMGIFQTGVNNDRFDTLYCYAPGGNIYYDGYERVIDRSGMGNIVVIAGPYSDPTPIDWDDDESFGMEGESDGDITKTFAPDAWEPSGIYATNDFTRPWSNPRGQAMKLTSAGGTAGKVEPTWSTVEGTTHADSALTWKIFTWNSYAVSSQFLTDDGGEIGWTIESIYKQQDTFTKPDHTASLGATTSEDDWDVWGTDVVAGILQNSAYFVSGTGPLMGTVDCQVASGTAEVKFSTFASGQRLIARLKDAESYWYLEATTDWRLYKRIGDFRSDTFSRVNSAVTLGSMETGGVSYTALSGTHGINSEQPYLAVHSAATNDAAVFDGGSTSGEWELTWDKIDTGMKQIWRVVSIPAQPYKWSGFYLTANGTTDWRVWTYIAGTPSLIATILKVPDDGDVVKVKVSGNVHTIYINGLLGATFTNATNNTSTLYGWAYTAVNTARFDDAYFRAEFLMSTIAQTPAHGDRPKLNCVKGVIEVYINDVFKSTTADGYLAGCTNYGIGVAAGGGAARFQDFWVRQTYFDGIIGLGEIPTWSDTGYTVIPWGVKFDAATRMAQVYAAGVAKGSAVSYAHGDKFLFTVKPAVTPGIPPIPEMRFYKNAAQFYTTIEHIDMSEDHPWYALAMIYTDGATFSDCTIQRYTYGIYTYEDSIDNYGPKPWPEIIQKDDLDTQRKRKAHSQAFFKVHGLPRIKHSIESHGVVTPGNRVLFNSTKRAITNELTVIAEADRKWTEDENGIPLYSYVLGDRDKEYGDDEVIGYIVDQQLDNRRIPDPPTGFTVMDMVRDGPLTIKVTISWDPGHQGQRDTEVSVRPVGRNEWTPFPTFAAQTGVGVIRNFLPDTAYELKIRFVDWNNKVSYWTSVQQIITPGIGLLDPPIITSFPTGYDKSGGWMDIHFTPVRGAFGHFLYHRDYRGFSQVEFVDPGETHKVVRRLAVPFGRYVSMATIDQYGVDGPRGPETFVQMKINDFVDAGNANGSVNSAYPGGEGEEADIAGWIIETDPSGTGVLELSSTPYHGAVVLKLTVDAGQPIDILGPPFPVTPDQPWSAWSAYKASTTPSLAIIERLVYYDATGTELTNSTLLTTPFGNTNWLENRKQQFTDTAATWARRRLHFVNGEATTQSLYYAFPVTEEANRTQNLFVDLRNDFFDWYSGHTQVGGWVFDPGAKEIIFTLAASPTAEKLTMKTANGGWTLRTSGFTTFSHLRAQRLALPADIRTATFTPALYGDQVPYYNCDATAGNMTVNLPSVATTDWLDQVMIFRKTDATANTITLDAFSTQSLNGALTYVLSVQYQYVVIRCGATEWEIIDRGYGPITNAEHGNLGGGSLHSAATGIANGFMSTTHFNLVNNAVSTNTNSTLMLRDGSGRAQVSTPSAGNDIANKTYVDAMIPKSLVDAKGDLLTATANDTPARLAVGTDTFVLTSDSGQATGLIWRGLSTHPSFWGGAFPGSPVTQQMFFRSDLGIWCWYDGTRWLGPELTLPLLNYQGTQPYSANTEAYACAALSDKPFYVTRFEIDYHVFTTNNAFNYWSATLRRLNSGIGFDTLGTISTNGGTNDTWTHPTALSSFSNNPTATSDHWWQVYLTKALGTPGNAYILPTVKGRHVYT